LRFTSHSHRKEREFVTDPTARAPPHSLSHSRTQHNHAGVQHRCRRAVKSHQQARGCAHGSHGKDIGHARRMGGCGRGRVGAARPLSPCLPLSLSHLCLCLSVCLSVCLSLCIYLSSSLGFRLHQGAVAAKTCAMRAALEAARGGRVGGCAHHLSLFNSPSHLPLSLFLSLSLFRVVGLGMATTWWGGPPSLSLPLPLSLSHLSLTLPL
jgi:hypothetical protein